jgi:hypothetical protein
MSQSKQRDYPRLAKRGFLLGLGLFLVGAGGAIGGTAVFGTLPSWSNTLFTDMELLGIVLGLFSPLIFGIVMPLIE